MTTKQFPTIFTDVGMGIDIAYTVFWNSNGDPEVEVDWKNTVYTGTKCIPMAADFDLNEREFEESLIEAVEHSFEEGAE